MPARTNGEDGRVGTGKTGVFRHVRRAPAGRVAHPCGVGVGRDLHPVGEPAAVTPSTMATAPPRTRPE